MNNSPYRFTQVILPVPIAGGVYPGPEDTNGNLNIYFYSGVNKLGAIHRQKIKSNSPNPVYKFSVLSSAITFSSGDFGHFAGPELLGDTFVSLFYGKHHFIYKVFGGGVLAYDTLNSKQQFIPIPYAFVGVSAGLSADNESIFVYSANHFIQGGSTFSANVVMGSLNKVTGTFPGPFGPNSDLQFWKTCTIIDDPRVYAGCEGKLFQFNADDDSVPVVSYDIPLEKWTTAFSYILQNNDGTKLYLFTPPGLQATGVVEVAIFDIATSQFNHVSVPHGLDYHTIHSACVDPVTGFILFVMEHEKNKTLVLINADAINENINYTYPLPLSSARSVVCDKDGVVYISGSAYDASNQIIIIQADKD